MKIDVRRLTAARELHLAESWGSASYDLDAPGWRFVSPVRIEASARRDSGLVIIEVAAAAKAELTCSRCQKIIVQPFTRDFPLAYKFDTSEPEIQLDNDIRQEIILGYPQKILCRDDCKGLCAGCGADLNEGACRCKRNEL